MTAGPFGVRTLRGVELEGNLLFAAGVLKPGFLAFPLGADMGVRCFFTPGGTVARLGRFAGVFFGFGGAFFGFRGIVSQATGLAAIISRRCEQRVMNSTAWLSTAFLILPFTLSALQPTFAVLQ